MSCGYSPVWWATSCGARSGETFGALLATRQAVQFAIADARVEINAARHLTWDAAYTHDHGQDARSAASIAKLYGTEMPKRRLRGDAARPERCPEARSL